MIPTGVALAESIAQLLGANLAEIGLNLDIQRVDFATFVDIYYGDLPEEQRPNLLPAFWSPDYNDGWNHLWPQLSSDAWNTGNAGHYRNDRVDLLLRRSAIRRGRSGIQRGAGRNPANRDQRRSRGRLLRPGAMADHSPQARGGIRARILSQPNSTISMRSASNHRDDII